MSVTGKSQKKVTLNSVGSLCMTFQDLQDT